jgi:Flp pilus assembly protein TadG
MSKFKQKGSSTVEFAMLVPLLLFLIFMVSELGTLIFRLNAVNKSVEIAARYLSDVSVNNGYTDTDEINAKNLAVCGHIAPCGLEAVVPGLAPADIVVTDLGQHVQVVATYESNLLLGSTLNTFTQMVTGGSTATDFMALGASSVMRFAQ